MAIYGDELTTFGTRKHDKMITKSAISLEMAITSREELKMYDTFSVCYFKDYKIKYNF